MSDLESLLVLLAALYLGECIHPVRRHALVLSRRFFGAYRPIAANRTFGNDGSGIAISSPSPIGTGFHVCEPSPLSFSEEGALDFSSLSLPPGPRAIQSGEFVPFSSMRSIEAVGKRVVVDGRTLARTATRGMAEHLTGLLRDLAALPRGKRASRLDREVRRSLDLREIRARAEAVDTARRAVEPWAAVVFLLLFGALPSALVFGLPRLGWIALVALLVLASCGTAYRTWRAFRALPAATGAPARSAFVLLGVSPVSAARAAELVAQHLLATFHPLAVAKVLAPESYEELARGFLRDARAPYWPACPFEDAERAQAANGWRERVGRALEAVASDPRSVPLAPAEPEDGVVASCERCGSAYVRADATCEPCGGRPLVPMLSTQGARK